MGNDNVRGTLVRQRHQANLTRLYEEKLAGQAKRRRDRAEKAVSVVVEEIISSIVRPGPKQEERECTTVAQEIRDSAPVLSGLVFDVMFGEEA